MLYSLDSDAVSLFREETPSVASVTSERLKCEAKRRYRLPILTGLLVSETHEPQVYITQTARNTVSRFPFAYEAISL